VMSKGLLAMGSIYPTYSPTTLDLSARCGDEILEPPLAESGAVPTPPTARARNWPRSPRNLALGFPPTCLLDHVNLSCQMKDSEQRRSHVTCEAGLRPC